MSYKFIDFFAGCGGMSLGLSSAGLDGLFAIEKDKWAFETFNHNLINTGLFEWPAWLPRKSFDIIEFERIYEKHIQKLNHKVDLIVGCPPCQGFSYRGKRQYDDNRNKLYNNLLSLVNRINPSILIFENVEGISRKFKKEDILISHQIEMELEYNGYKPYIDILNCADYGVPQQRRRYFIWALNKSDFNGNLRNPFKMLEDIKDAILKEKGINKIPIPVKEAIHDLRKLKKNLYKNNDFKSFKFGKYSEPISEYQSLMRTGITNDYPDSHRFPNHSQKIIERFQLILKNCEKGRAISVTDKKRLVP